MNAHKVQLGDVCEFVRGVTFDKNEVTTKPEVGKIPILRAGNIGEELDVQNDLVWVPESVVGSEQLLRQNDIAICMSSGSSAVVGKTARAASNLHASVGSFCGIIRPKSADQAAYLSFFFRSPTFFKHRDAIARGANIQNLRFSQFEEIVLEIPLEQERISGELEQADRLRRTRRYTLELSDAFLRAAFVSLFGNPAKNSKYPLVPLGELIVRGPQNGLYKPAAAYGSGTRIVRIDAYQNSSAIDFAELQRVRLSSDEIATYGLLKGDFLINRVNSRTHLGKSTVVPRLSEPAVYESNMMRFRVDENRLNPVYAAQFLHTPFINEQIQKLAKDASNQASINQEDVEGFVVLLPPLVAQHHFAVLVLKHERLRANQREALRQTDHLFQSLLDRAFR